MRTQELRAGRVHVLCECRLPQSAWGVICSRVWRGITRRVNVLSSIGRLRTREGVKFGDEL